MTSPATHDPTLLVHGGAWAIPAKAAAAHQQGVREALETGYKVLALGGSALDAVEAAVTVLEDDPIFDAGRGSFLTSDGRVQLDALLMDGGRMKAGGVACVERLRNPIQAARLVLEQSPHVYFVGAGAEQFAAAHGMILIGIDWGLGVNKRCDEQRKGKESGVWMLQRKHRIRQASRSANVNSSVQVPVTWATGLRPIRRPGSGRGQRCRRTGCSLTSRTRGEPLYARLLRRGRARRWPG